MKIRISNSFWNKIIN